MSESNQFGVLGLALLGLVFVGTAAGVAYFGGLPHEKILEATFAASAEGALGVFLVGVVVLWYQSRASIREKKTEMLRELSRIREKVGQAQFLMTAHKSAKTWTEQTRELVILIPRLADLQETTTPNGPSQTERSALDRAKANLEGLKEEYWQKHVEIDKLGTQWDTILATVPLSKQFIVDADSPLLMALTESIRSLKRELRL